MKIKPIVRGKIVVWPLIPRLTASAKFRDRTGDPERDNVVVMPVVKIERFEKSAPSYNDIQKVLAKTMRDQRVTKRSNYAQEKLRRMFLDKA